MKRTVFLTMLIAAVLGACGGDGAAPEVSEARVGEPTGPNAALYFTASSDLDDTLLGAESDVATEIQIHQTTMGDDGTMGMQPVDTLSVSSGERLVLEPGGLHLMLIDVVRLEEGEQVDVTLFWENAGEQTISADVVAPDETMGHGG